MKTSSRLNLPLWLIAKILPAALLMLGAQTSHAASATWNLNPGSNDWNTPFNWTPATVPNGPLDIATFGLSNQTGISLSTVMTEVDSIVFSAGASAYTISSSDAFTLDITGAGIVNNLGIAQNFVNGAGTYSYLDFRNNATAGTSMLFTNAGGTQAGQQGSQIYFSENSTAGNASFTNKAGTAASSYPGNITFVDNATAGNAAFTNEGSYNDNSDGGQIYFTDSSSAANGTFTNSGPTGPDGYSGGYIQIDSTAANGTFINNGGVGALGGITRIYGTAASSIITNNGGTASGGVAGKLEFAGTAGSATLIANGGTNGGDGGEIEFYSDSTGGTARVAVFGNGFMDIYAHNPPGMTIGSVEGSGNVFVGGQNLTVGSNNTARSFSGAIQDVGGPSTGINGVLTKIGTGTLTFEGGASNDHIGDAVTLSIASNATINLNFTGDPDIVRSLIVSGVAQVPGLYGSAASGAPHQLPQFTGTGKVLVKMLAVSRKPHGAAGDFDINLPFGGAPGIECRSSGANGNYQVVVSFVNPVTFSNAILFGSGTVSSTTGNGTTIVTVNLTGVTNEQAIDVLLQTVNDGTTTEDIPIPIGILIGDTNGDRVVNSGDSTQTKNRAGQPTDATNFRSDVNEDGVINSGDSSIVKSHAGTSLP